MTPKSTTMPQDMTPSAIPAAPPPFELTSFLDGHTRAWGVFEDRFGRLRRRFTVEMHGRWQGEVFMLDEGFVYDTGESETRTWAVTPLGAGRFRATCADCIGSANGESDADSVRMTYRFRLKLKDREIAVDFDDRLYRMGDTIAVNRATMSKWGIKIGELSLFFQRREKVHAPDPSAAA
jgi:Protein of unknown function (DUF3833)